MIRHISIRNFAVIENVAIDFDEGLSIMTGETGAGKSVMIQAVSLALGSRADSTLVRTGAEKAIIQLVAEHRGKEYIIKREISQSGKNLCKINDNIVTLSHLNMLCRNLADIHGQYDHQQLLDPERHILFLDEYAKDETEPLKAALAELYREYGDIAARVRSVTAEREKLQQERDFIAFQLDELERANLISGEDEKLENEIALLQNSEKIFAGLNEAFHMAYEDDSYSAFLILKRISDLLADTSKYSKDLESLYSCMENIYYEFEDACNTLRDLKERCVFSPDSLDLAIERAEILNKLKSKHGKSLDELLEFKNALKDQLTFLEESDLITDELESELRSCRDRLSAQCDKLTDVRRKAAEKLETEIMLELEELNFKNAIFRISFKKNDAFTATGNDSVEFVISTNRGETPKPLVKIVSGGEMSRIMLAFKKIIGTYDNVPTMIFDEIDSGISGVTASIVGKKLREISRNHQVICITHLPQIASYGDRNYKIDKYSDEKMTYTTVSPLSENEKTREIARLIGGSKVTETTVSSAEELIKSSMSCE